MMEALVERVTFAAGEVSPVLRSRSDLAKTQTALWYSRNMVVLPEGGITRRPGTVFIAPLKDVTQIGLLIPFRFATNDVLLLAFNAGYMMVIANGGVVMSGAAPYYLAIPYMAADLPNLRFAQSGNDVFLACDGHRPQVLVRNGSDSAWTLSPYASTGGPVDVQNLNTGITIQASAATGAGITLTGTGTAWDAGLIGSVFKLAAANISDVPIWVADGTVSVGSLQQYQGNVYQCTAVSGTSGPGPTPPTHLDGSISYATGTGSITWEFINPGYGYVTITAVASATSATATVTLPTGATTWQLPADCVSGATYRWSPPLWSADVGYPDRVMCYDDRLIWAKGNQFYFTTNDNFYDFDQNATDTSAIVGQLISDDGALIEIEWMMQNGVVLVGGHDGEILLFGSDVYAPLTAATLVTVPDTRKGSCPQIPQRAEGGTLFLSRDRKRLYHIIFSPLTQRVSVREVTLFARHALAPLAVRIAWQQDPNQVAWIICQDGSLVSVTFDVEQNISGVCLHPLTNGFVEDIAAIQSEDDTTTQVYLIVRRVINGVTQRYIEMIQPYFNVATTAADASGAWFVDCGGQYSGAPATVIGGLSYLAGQIVNAHADGACFTGLMVDPVLGHITLPTAHANVVVGLPVNWLAQTLPIDLNTQKGSTRGARKRASEVILDLVNSAGGQIQVNPQGEEPEGPDDLELTGAMNYGAAVPLFTGTMRVDVGSETEDTCVVALSGSDTMPFTLTGVSAAVIVEGAL